MFLRFISLVVLFASSEILAQSSGGDSFPPLFDVHPNHQIVLENSGVTLRCSAKGFPQPIYSWVKDDHKISGAVDPILRIARVSRGDQGIYRCRADNSVGASLSNSANLTVAYVGDFAKFDLGQSIRAPKGDSIVLPVPRLDASPLRLVTWEWFFNDLVITGNQSHFVSANGDLVMLNVGYDQSGRYNVRATHTLLSNTPVPSPAYTVTVTSDPLSTWISSGSPRIVYSSKDLICLKQATFNESFPNDCLLECVGISTSGFDTIQLQWYHNDTVISSDTVKYHMTDFGRRLRIKNPSSSRDGGVYTCEVRQQFSSLSGAKQKINVVVFDPPTFNSDTDSKAVFSNFGLPADIPCQFSGNPSATVKWYLNARSLEADLQCCPNNPPLLYKPETSVLRITQVSESSGGVYQCEVTNPAGSAISSTWLKPQVMKPIILIPPENQTVTAGQTGSLLLRCPSAGSPEPTVSWLLNGATILVDNVRYGLEPGGNLRLISPEPSQSGDYMCLVKNANGEATATARVEILGKTLITKGPQDQTVVIGSNVLFPCEVAESLAKGNPERIWYFKDQRLSPASSSRIELKPDGSLLVRQVGPPNIGSYTCEITTAAGPQRQSGRLSIVEKPGMPLQVQARLVNDSSPIRVELMWHEGFDGNSPIIKFLAQSRQLSNSGEFSEWETTVENIGKDMRRVSIDNLKPSVTYEFRILAANKFGPGIPSMPSNSVTMPQQPPAAAPRNVAGSARSSSSIMVQWQTPPADQWNGDLFGFIVRYRLADYADIPWNYKNVSDSRTLNILLEDLITWREYEIQAAAYNNRGTGVFSKSQYITTSEGVPLDHPNNVTVVVINSTAVKADWVPPAQQQIPGVNLGYKVEFWRSKVGVGKPDFRQVVLPLNPTRMSAIVSGLGRYTAYNVTVLCFTTPGDGPRSQPIVITTEQDIPGPIENLRFDEIMFSSVLLVWDSPANPNGQLLNYTLMYWVSNRTSETKVTKFVSPNETSYKVEGLTASTHYTFEIFSSTVVGRGPSKVASIESGVPPELPGPPTGLILSNIQARSVYIQFTPGFDGKTLISKWIVEGQVGQSTNWVQVYNVSAPQSRAITVASLRPYTMYSLRLLAKNVVGESSASEATERFQTLQASPQHPPEDLSVQPDSSTSVKVAWTPLPSNSWNGVPKGYMLLYRGANVSTVNSTRYLPEQTKILIEDPAATEYTLQFLEPDSTYEVIVAAYNEVGQSDSTPVISATTYEDCPSAPPSNLEVSAESPRSIRLRWDEVPKKYRNGQLLGYKIFYTVATENATPKVLEISGADQRSVLINSGLEPYSTYQIQMAAFTIIGDGVRNEPAKLVRTRQDVPGPPVDLIFPMVSANEVRITWKKPINLNGEIMRYAVEYRRNDSLSSVRRELAKDLLFYAASGLDAEKIYRFSVTAESEVGFGSEAVAYVVPAPSKYPPQRPGRPSQSSSHPRGADQITLIWEMNDQWVAPVRFYSLQFQPVNGDWQDWSQNIPGTEKHFAAKRLVPNTPYRFHMKAVNDFGQSDWSPDSDWIKTFEAEPSLPPTDIKATPFGSQTAKITWKAPPLSSWNSDFVGYRVLYKTYRGPGSFESRELAMESSADSKTEVLLENLTRFQHYVVMLQAFNRQGSSVRSLPTFVFVGHSIPKTPVTGLKAASLSSTQVQISWDPWKEMNKEVISGFKVTYAQSKAVHEQTQDIVRLGGENGLVLKDLGKFADYLVRVQPFNRAGDGPVAELKVTTKEDRPGIVSDLKFTDILITSVNVTWTPPKDPNGQIVGYLVVYETYKLAEEFVKKIQEKTTDTFLLASGLEENVTYTFTVKAETVIGYGPPVSGKVTLGPQEGSPPAPLKPKIKVGDESILLDWETPGHTRDPVTSHLVQFLFLGLKNPSDTTAASESTRPKRQTVPAKWETLATAQTAQTSYTVTYSNLQAGGSYRFRIVARNRLGVSYPSPPSDVVFVPLTTEKAFYLKWYFMVILALVSVVILVIVVAVLYVTGRNNTKFNYEKRNSDFSLQLADGGFLTYDLRPSETFGTTLPPNSTNSLGKPPKQPGSMNRRPNNHYVNNPPPPRPSGAYSDADTIPVKRMSPPRISSPIQNLPNLYDSLAGVNRHVSQTFHQPDSVQQVELQEDNGEFDNDPGDSSNEDEHSSQEELDKDVSSIAQHYVATNDVRMQSWQRAKKTATAGTPLQRDSLASSQSANFSFVTPYPSPGASTSHYGVASNSRSSRNVVAVSSAPGSRAPVPGFSSFV